LILSNPSNPQNIRNWFAGWDWEESGIHFDQAKRACNVNSENFSTKKLIKSYQVTSK